MLIHSKPSRGWRLARVLLLWMSPMLALVDPACLAAQDPPGAYALLENVRNAYEALDSYRDRGHLTRTSGESTERTTFETWYSPDGFRLDFDNSREVFWQDGPQGWVYDARRSQYRASDSLAAEWTAHFGPAALDALVVPSTLLGFSDGLDDPEGASVDGPVDCSGSSCWLLTLSRMGGTIETFLQIDARYFLIRRVEVGLWPASTATVGQGTDRGTEKLVVELEWQLANQPEAVADLLFVPPAAAELVDEFTALAESDDDADDKAKYDFYDEISVENATLVVRVLDRVGDAITGLRPEDFVAKAGKAELPIVAVDWVSPFADSAVDFEGLSASVDGGRAVRPASGRPTRAGRLIVIFAQADFNAVRIKGQLRLRPLFEKNFLASLHPNDWVAVMAYDSHLKLWHDFSRDHSTVHNVLFEAIRFGGQPVARRNRRGPSLYEHFDPAAGREIAEPEKAFEMIGHVLKGYPGNKDLIYLGWGFGQFDFQGVRMKTSYFEAREALRAAKVTVHALDATYAGYHDLELGMKKVAIETGGTYQKAGTAFTAPRATRRLASMMQGYYVLTLDVASAPSKNKVEVKLRRDEDGKKAEGELIYRSVRIAK